MQRTTIMLPASLKAKATQEADRRGVSLGELIRQALDQAVEDPLDPSTDALLADEAVFRGETPGDLAENHDRYLYDEG